MVDAIVTMFLVVGAAFLLLAAVAALRMPDIYCRLSASTKAVTFGTSTMFVAAAIYFAGSAPMLRAIAGIAFFFATSPIAAHVLARAAYARGTPMWEGSVVDEWQASGTRDEQPDPVRGDSALPQHNGAE